MEEFQKLLDNAKNTIIETLNKIEKCRNNGVNLIFYTNIKKYIDNIETFNKATIINKIKTYESKTEN